MEGYTQITLDQWVQWKEDIRQKLAETADNFVHIGYRLKQIRDSGMFGGAADIFEFAQKEYGLGKSTVSRFIAINEKYSEGGNSLELKAEFRGFSSSKLSEMLTLPDNEIELINEKTTIRAIRELKQFNAADPDKVRQEERGPYTPLEKCLIDFFDSKPDVLKDVIEHIRKEQPEYKQAAELMAPSGQAFHKKGLVFLFLYGWNEGVKYKLMTEPAPVSMTWIELLNIVNVIYAPYDSADVLASVKEDSSLGQMEVINGSDIPRIYDSMDMFLPQDADLVKKLIAEGVKSLELDYYSMNELDVKKLGEKDDFGIEYNGINYWCIFEEDAFWKNGYVTVVERRAGNGIRRYIDDLKMHIEHSVFLKLLWKRLQEIREVCCYVKDACEYLKNSARREKTQQNGCPKTCCMECPESSSCLYVCVPAMKQRLADAGTQKEKEPKTLENQVITESGTAPDPLEEPELYEEIEDEDTGESLTVPIELEKLENGYIEGEYREIVATSQHEDNALVGQNSSSEKDRILKVIAELSRQCNEYSEKEAYQEDFRRNKQIIRWLADYMNYIAD